MAKQSIDLGTTPNDGTGSNLRVGGDIINDNFNEVYTTLGDGSDLAFDITGVSNGQTLIYNSATSKFEAGAASSSFTVAGNGGSNQTISGGDTLTITGSTGIDTTGAATDTINIAIDSTVLTNSSTHTLTNKTFDANGTGNSISNIEVADLASGVLDTDLNSVAGTDTTLASAKAIKTYVDTIAAAGIHYHTAVRVESPINLNASYDNGTSGVGATLTNSGTLAAISIDGVALSLNDRVLIYNQSNAAHNGVYYVSTVGDGATAWVLTRTTDTDSYGASDSDSLGEGDAFFVQEGDTGAGELYVMNTSGTITFGTTNITFTVIAETAVYSAGTGLTLAGTEFSLTNSSITINGTSISLGNSGTISAGTDWQAGVVADGSTVTVATAGEGYFIDTTSFAHTLQLPVSPTIGDEISIIDVAGTFDTNNLTVDRNGKPISGSAADLTVSVERAGFTLVFYDNTQGWVLKDK